MRVGKGVIPGRPTDTQGNFWSFDAQGLAPGQAHTLELLDERKRPLCDPWQVKTFPAPGDKPKSFRLLIYTCAGGDERVRSAKGVPQYVPISSPFSGIL